MVQSDAGLDEALVMVLGGAGLDADRSAAADAIEEPSGVADRGHSQERQEFAVEGASGGEVRDGEDDMRHAVDFDAHGRSDRCYRMTPKRCMPQIVSKNKI